MDLSELQTDAQAELNGRWFPYGDAEFLIGSSNRKPYKKAVRAALKRLPSHLKDDPASHDRIGAECGHLVLLGWKGLKNKGADFPYTEENAKIVMANREMMNWVLEQAADSTNFRPEDAARDAEGVKSDG